jgi:methylenetetrahydrofolate reductase (NADPH)
MNAYCIGDIKALDDHIELASRIQTSSGLPVMLHIAIAQLSRDDCSRILAACRAAGIINIMALRGDPVVRAGSFAFMPHENGFSCARDFVKFIRDTTGDFFCVAVAGYPGTHTFTYIHTT